MYSEHPLAQAYLVGGCVWLAVLVYLLVTCLGTVVEFLDADATDLSAIDAAHWALLAMLTLVFTITWPMTLPVLTTHLIVTRVR